MNLIKRCACGKVLRATSKNQMGYNFERHIESGGHKRIMKEGKFEKCQRCGNQAKLLIHVHHKNKDHKDNRKENLEYLCEKCHKEHTKKNNIKFQILEKQNGNTNEVKKPVDEIQDEKVS